MMIPRYKIDVNIADDHTMFAEGLADAINNSDTAHVSRRFTTLEACRQTLQERRPDVLLLDISMPLGPTANNDNANIDGGIDFCRFVVENYPKVKVLAITSHDEYSIIRRMLDSGAHGYVLKSAPVQELLDAISAVYQGKRYINTNVQDIINQGERKAIALTMVEQNILRLICDGFTNPEIAVKQNLSTETVNWYRKRLLAKFGAKNTVTLVKQALTEKLV
jgi:DNA-binding NarL/FixJ family response regulator